MIYSVCQAISDMVTEENLAEGRLYPPLNTIREVSFKIAVKVGDLSTSFISQACNVTSKLKAAYVHINNGSNDYLYVKSDEPTELSPDSAAPLSSAHSRRTKSAAKILDISLKWMRMFLCNNWMIKWDTVCFEVCLKGPCPCLQLVAPKWLKINDCSCKRFWVHKRFCDTEICKIIIIIICIAELKTALQYQTHMNYIITFQRP